jgi:hypothetical protein
MRSNGQAFKQERRRFNQEPRNAGASFSGKVGFLASRFKISGTKGFLIS